MRSRPLPLRDSPEPRFCCELPGKGSSCEHCYTPHFHCCSAVFRDVSVSAAAKTCMTRSMMSPTTCAAAHGSTISTMKSLMPPAGACTAPALAAPARARSRGTALAETDSEAQFSAFLCPTSNHPGSATLTLPHSCHLRAELAFPIAAELLSFAAQDLLSRCGNRWTEIPPRPGKQS